MGYYKTLSIASVKSKGDRRQINFNVFGRKQSCHSRVACWNFPAEYMENDEKPQYGQPEAVP
jgi:hypothetical protein